MRNITDAEAGRLDVLAGAAKKEWGQGLEPGPVPHYKPPRSIQGQSI